MHGLENSSTGSPRVATFPFYCTTSGGQSAQLESTVQNGERVLRFDAGAGLYQLSVIADASEFDWEELCITLNAFHNENQRTGPWDFDLLKDNRPLVPSYWVYLDGQKIGLWYFQRVSLEDMEAKRFRGRLAFWLSAGGEHEIRLQPYREMKLRWQAARLETDPEDTLLPEAPEPLHEAVGLPYGREFWAQRKALLPSTHSQYREPLRRAYEAVKKVEEPEPNEWVVLLSAYFMEDDEAALGQLLQMIDAHLDKPAWNNLREDGYGHNGDMGAAFPLRAFALVLLSLDEELGAERRQRMLRKAELQGSLFIRQALLHRDYWGGSLLQDHGWRSTLSFCCAALRLAPMLPAANEWLRYSLPRVHRSLAAMPRDGVVPESSHNSLILYLDDVSELRDELLRWNGEDLYDLYPFREIVDYVAAVHAPAGQAMMVGGSGFFNQLASKFRCPRAAAVQQRLLATGELDWAHPTVRIGYYSNIVRGLMTYDPIVAPAKSLAGPAFHWFPDTALAHNRKDGVTFRAQCGPWVGAHADRHATGPCDRMGLAPGAGHFSLARDGVDLLATPDGGYGLRSALRSCLLIDGHGQHGDIGYPMSIPSKLHHGEMVESAVWDDATGTGRVRLQLAPAYPAPAGVAAYTRDFLISDHRLVVRDYLVLNQPRPLTWLFQLKRENGVSLHADDDAEGGISAEIGGARGVRLSARPAALRLWAEIRPTPVVWSYTSINGFKPFDSLCFDTAEPVAAAAVDFIIQW